MARRGRNDDEDASKYEWGGGAKKEAESVVPEEVVEKKPKKLPKMQLEPSSLLRQEALKDEKGVVVEYVASDDSAMPNKHWMLYPFKGKEALETIPLDRQEWYLFGKDRTIAHIPTDHLSCSRQHAVIQFRRRVSRNQFGDEIVAIKPYVMDLKSSNGTLLNGEKLDPLRYYELRHEDMLQFAQSSRQYVVMCKELAKK